MYVISSFYLLVFDNDRVILYTGVNDISGGTGDS